MRVSGTQSSASPLDAEDENAAHQLLPTLKTCYIVSMSRQMHRQTARYMRSRHTGRHSTKTDMHATTYQIQNRCVQAGAS